MSKEKNLNLPNILATFRILLAPLMLWFMIDRDKALIILLDSYDAYEKLFNMASELIPYNVDDRNGVSFEARMHREVFSAIDAIQSNIHNEIFLYLSQVYLDNQLKACLFC